MPTGAFAATMSPNEIGDRITTIRDDTDAFLDCPEPESLTAIAPILGGSASAVPNARSRSAGRGRSARSRGRLTRARCSIP